MNVKVIAILSLIILGIGISFAIQKTKSTANDANKQLIYKYLIDEGHPLFIWIKNAAWRVSVDTFDNNQFTNYETFRYNCIENILKSVHNKIDTYGTNWVGFPSTVKKNEYVKTYFNEILSLAIGEIVNSNSIDCILATIFADTIATNVNEAKQIEEDTIKYLSEFGEEPSNDPELHPRVSDNDASTDEEIQYKSIDELSSTGTVEDIENDK